MGSKVVPPARPCLPLGALGAAHGFRVECKNVRSLHYRYSIRPVHDSQQSCFMLGYEAPCSVLSIAVPELEYVTKHLFGVHPYLC